MKAVILAGGKGMRLMPFTTRLPKPLMPIGEHTIVEHLLSQLADCGVGSVTLCVAHHAELIENVLQTSRRDGLQVDFRRDRRPGMSTLAPVRQLLEELPSHFLLLNADILCDVDFGRLYRQAVDSGAPVTVAIREDVVPGTHPRCSIEPDGRITGYDTTPADRQWINMGIYVLTREALARVPLDQPYGMDTLMRDLLAEGGRIEVYRSHDTWIDVGIPEELARAQDLVQRTGAISAVRRTVPVAAAPVAAPARPPAHVEETGIFSISAASWGAIYTRAQASGQVRPRPAASPAEVGVRRIEFPPGPGPGHRAPMAILMVCGAGPAPLIGSERYALHLARELAAQGDRVTLVLQTPGELQSEDVAGAEVMPLPALDLRTLATQVGMPHVVLGVDLVWSPAARTAIDVARAWRVPAVVLPASAQDAWLDLTAGIAVCGDADLVLAVTAAEGRALVRRGVAPGKLRVVGYGAYAPGADTAAGHGLPIHGDYVLFLGRKRRDKGYLALLDAAPRVWKTHPATSFVFVGPRTDADCLTAFGRHAGDPRIVEAEGLSVAAKDAVVAGCSLLCLPTTADIFPQVFLEAWRAGRPVVSGPFDGVDEVVRDGVDGRVAAAHGEPLAEVLQALLDDPAGRAAMGAAGRERVVGELSWPSMTRRVADRLAEIGALMRT